MARTISVVVPCYNEAAHITGLLGALRDQTLQPSEIVIADCRSSDDTLEVIAAFSHGSLLPPLHVVSCERRSTPMALNRAIQASSGDVIVRLDGHSRPDRDHLRCCLQALDSSPAGIVGGLWSIQPGAATASARAIAVAAAHPFGAGDALYRVGHQLTGPKEVDTVPFGCFRRALWEELGGFDEHFLVNQDYEFNYRVRLAGHRVMLDPRIRATYTARSTLWQLAHQYFRYGWWKAETLKRHPSSLRWRQAVPAGFVAAVLLLAALSVIEPRVRVALAALVLLYASATVVASVHAAGRARAWSLVAHLPRVFATIHFAWGAGLLSNMLTGGGRLARAGFVARLARRARTVLLITGAVTVVGVLWLVAGLPLGIDAWLNVATAPAPSDAIVCIAGGTMAHDLPTSEGWQRIHTSVALFSDKYAPIVVFTGRGNEKVSQAEIYADAARWMGMPPDAVRLDPLAASTADHPDTLLRSLAGTLTPESRLLLVTSNVHSRRVLMTFRKRGFRNVRVVSDYTPSTRLPQDSRKEVSSLPAFTSDSKRYDDPLFTLAYRSAAALTALREWSAIAVYRWRNKL